MNADTTHVGARRSRTRRVLMMCAAVSVVVMAGRTGLGQVPARPSAEQLDPKLMQAATLGAVQSGIATLLARQQAPANDSGLVFPPHTQRKIVDKQKVERRFRREMVTVPVWKDHLGDQLVAVRNEYGEVTGYEVRRVVVRREKVGERQEERWIADPEGDVVREITIPVYDRAGQWLYPRGFHGMNGMALYVLARAGLGGEREARLQAISLQMILERYGIPDHTWDLAWLVAGFVNMPDEQYKELTELLVTRLVDGQNRARGAVEGLWGPVSIHYDMLVRVLDAEVKLQGQLGERQKRLDAEGDKMPVADRRRLTAELEQFNRSVAEVLAARRAITQQGHRFSEVTRAYSVDDVHRFAGLSYSIYHHLVADMDSTAAAAFALDEARRQGRLPAQLQRPKLGTAPLGRPEPTVGSLQTALAALSRTQGKHGGWAEVNALVANTAFPPALFPPLTTPLPVLVTYESVDANLSGASALAHLMRAVGPSGRRYTRQLELADQRAAAVLDRYLNQSLTQVTWPATHERQSQVPPSDARGGPVQPPPVDIPVAGTPVEDLPYGFTALPYTAIENTLGLFRPLEDGGPARHEDLLRQLSYRLIATQGEDGQWRSGPSWGVGMSSAEFAHTLQQAFERPTKAIRRADKDDDEFHHGKMIRRMIANPAYSGEPALYPTLVSLALLVESLQGSISMADVPILPETQSPATEVVAGEAGDEGEMPEPMTPEQAARSVDRPNAAWTDLKNALAP